VFDRLGGRRAKIERLRKFALCEPLHEDICALLPVPEQQEGGGAAAQLDGPLLVDGFVYMMKLGKHYKIGKTFSVPRRHRQIAMELPEKPNIVHSIRTDDPDGIEAYWHRRFEAKRTNGEWFTLNASDVRAFKRRRFM
jgi:hypothetical protein